MAKYILTYKGSATDMENMSAEDSKKVMMAWKVWMEAVGSNLVDVGAPMANGLSIVDDGSEGVASELSGYSIVEANDIDDAKALAKDHPFLSEGAGNFAIDIFELMPVPMDS